MWFVGTMCTVSEVTGLIVCSVFASYNVDSYYEET